MPTTAAAKANANTLERAVDEIKRLPIDEYIVTRTHTDTYSVQCNRERVYRQLETERVTAHLFRDTRRGRSSTTVELDATVDSYRYALQQAMQLVAPKHNRQQPWRLPPTSAPARVEVFDQACWSQPLSVANETATQLKSHDEKNTQACRVSVESSLFQVYTSLGFNSSYRATRIEARARLVTPSGPITVASRARSQSRLALAKHLADATQTAHRAGNEHALPAGSYDVVLPARVVSSRWPRAPFGLLTPLVTQADGRKVRLGLSRYRPGQSIYPRSPIGDRITLTSDGTIDMGLRSRPFGELGEATRRYELIVNGRAAGLSLDAKEAGLRNAPANGGVGNLLVSAGSANSTQDLLAPKQRPVLEVLAIDELETDHDSGRFECFVTAARLHSGRKNTTVRNTVLADRLFARLTDAQFSSALVSVGWYHGPAAWRLNNVRVI